MAWGHTPTPSPLHWWWTRTPTSETLALLLSVRLALASCLVWTHAPDAVVGVQHPRPPGSVAPVVAEIPFVRPDHHQPAHRHARLRSRPRSSSPALPGPSSSAGSSCFAFFRLPRSVSFVSRFFVFPSPCDAASRRYGPRSRTRPLGCPLTRGTRGGYCTTHCFSWHPCEAPPFRLPASRCSLSSPAPLVPLEVGATPHHCLTPSRWRRSLLGAPLTLPSVPLASSTYGARVPKGTTAVFPLPTMLTPSLPPPLPLPPPASAPVAVPSRPVLWAAGRAWAPACAADAGGGSGDGGGVGGGDAEPASDGTGSSMDADADADAFADDECGGGDGKGGTGGGDGKARAVAPAGTVPFVSGESPVTPEAGWVEAALGATRRPHKRRHLPPPALTSPADSAGAAPVLSPPLPLTKGSATAVVPPPLPPRPRRPDTRRSRGEFTRRLLLSSMGW